MKNFSYSLALLCAIVFTVISCEKDNNLKSLTSETTLTNIDTNPIAMPINGMGSSNYLARWTTPHTLGISLIYDNDTNIGIGTITPAYKLDVNGNINAQGNLYAKGVVASGNFGNLTIVKNPAAFIGTYDKNNLMLGANGAPAIWINTTGRVGLGFTNPAHRLDVDGEIGATGFVQSSDINLKKNIQTLDNSLEKILSLRGVSFNWRSNDKSSVGLIAQEVELVYPELISGKRGRQGVQYANLVGPLIEAIKSQQAMINCQQERINSLEERLSKLEQQPLAKR